MQVLRHNFSHQFHKIRSLTCNFAGLAVAILLVLSVFLAPSAAAHDVLVASDPEDGAEVEAPSSFTLTFNNDPLDVNPLISISGPDGQESALELEPTVDGRDVYVDLPDMEPGKYEVSWRIVSSDGHPISGEQSFSVIGDGSSSDDESSDNDSSSDDVTDSDEPVSSDDEDADASSDSDDSGDDSQSADEGTDDEGAEPESAAAADNDDGGAPVGMWIALGIAIAVALGLFGTYAARKKGKEPTDETPSQSQSHPPK